MIDLETVLSVPMWVARKVSPRAAIIYGILVHYKELGLPHPSRVEMGRMLDINPNTVAAHLMALSMAKMIKIHRSPRYFEILDLPS